MNRREEIKQRNSFSPNECAVHVEQSSILLNIDFEKPEARAITSRKMTTMPTMTNNGETIFFSVAAIVRPT